MKLKELTRAEEQIMQVLWRLEKAFVNDIIEQLPSPKPAYNTVSTIVRILEKKGFVSHTAFGKTHQYHPLISRDRYRKFFIKIFVKEYFSDSYAQMVSFFSRHDDVSIGELEEIKQIMESELREKKGG